MYMKIMAATVSQNCSLPLPIGWIGPSAFQHYIFYPPTMDYEMYAYHSILVRLQSTLSDQLCFCYGWISLLKLMYSVYVVCSGSWRQKQFKSLNFDSCGKMPDGGHLHPLLKVRTQFRQIFLEMG